MSDEKGQVFSKKIFFLYPVSVVFDFLKELIRYGYEVYVIKDHNQIPLLVKKYPYSIVYINIFEKMEEKEWEKFIKEIINNPENIGVQIGICTYSTSNDEYYSAKYLIDLGLTGGYINLYTSYKKSLDNILKVLEASEARGKRKYVRVNPFVNDKNTLVMVDVDGKQYQGRIIDLSIYCMSVEFGVHCLVKNQILRKVIMKLRGVPFPIQALVKGFHSDNQNIYLLIFINLTENIKSKIFDYIYERLQAEVQDV
jgi:hypothetical protein